MTRFKRILSGGKANIALATISVQIANFAMLFFAKGAMTDEAFAFYITQTAAAGIIGAFATLRLEMLIYKHFARMTIAAILVPFATAILIVGLSLLIMLGLKTWVAAMPDVTYWAGLLMLGIGMSTAADFLLIQKRQLHLMLASRLFQAAGLATIALILAFDVRNMNGTQLLIAQGAVMLTPPLLWLSVYSAGLAREGDAAPYFLRPSRDLLWRSGAISGSTVVNALYVNLPLLIASATQSAAFTADFGLISRFLTGPVRFIRQVFGQPSLAGAFDWAHERGAKTSQLAGMIWRTVGQSASAYAIVGGGICAFLIIAPHSANLRDASMVPWLFIAVMGQSAISPVSQVRTVVGDEGWFLAYDIMRVVILVAALTTLAMTFRFDIVFGIVSCALYLSYLGFIRRRIARMDQKRILNSVAAVEP